MFKCFNALILKPCIALDGFWFPNRTGVFIVLLLTPPSFPVQMDFSGPSYQLQAARRTSYDRSFTDSPAGKTREPLGLPELRVKNVRFLRREIQSIHFNFHSYAGSLHKNEIPFHKSIPLQQREQCNH